MVTVIGSSTVDGEAEHWSGQTKDHKIWYLPLIHY